MLIHTWPFLQLRVSVSLIKAKFVWPDSQTEIIMIAPFWSRVAYSSLQKKISSVKIMAMRQNYLGGRGRLTGHTISINRKTIHGTVLANEIARIPIVTY